MPFSRSEDFGGYYRPRLRIAGEPNRDREPKEPENAMENRNTREPEFFWHNVGFRSKGDASSRLREASRGISLARRNNWWRYLLRNGEVSANRKNEPGDRGEKLLKSYIADDRIIIYAGGYWAIGWGVVDEPRYALVGEGSVRDVFPRSLNRHRLKGISWKEQT